MTGHAAVVPASGQAGGDALVFYEPAFAVIVNWFDAAARYGTTGYSAVFAAISTCCTVAAAAVAASVRTSVRR